MKKFVLILGFALSLIVLTYLDCTSPARAESAARPSLYADNSPNSGANSNFFEGKREVEPEFVGQGIVPYGSDVFYFSHTGARFGNALSAFLGKHQEYDSATPTPHFESRSFTGGGTIDCTGYFVHFHRRPKS
ncbi:MAG TPA: hypothetical protein VFQ72_04275 [Candidatus Paceibacterota bacterium]|nr:hypothetical protein [Candidatus Paceibacterota bacterium]